MIISKHLAGLVADAGRNTADAYEHHLKNDYPLLTTDHLLISQPFVA